MRVYDPRDNAWKESNNPALIALFFILTDCTPQPKIVWDYLWTNSSIWADFCDEEVDEHESETN